MTNSFPFRHPALRTLIFVLATSLASFASAIGTFDRSFQVSGPVDLEVLTRSGDITVRNGAAGSVSIHATIHSGNSWFSGDRKAEVQELQSNPPIRQNGNNIRIDYVNLSNISVDYEITVPENTAIRAHTGSGDQTIEGLKGNIDLESGSGDLRLARLTGQMRFQTGSGNVKGRELSGPAKIKAGSGDIEIEELGAGDVDIRSAQRLFESSHFEPFHGRLQRVDRINLGHNDSRAKASKRMGATFADVAVAAHDRHFARDHDPRGPL